MECVSLHTGSYFCETLLTSAVSVKIKSSPELCPMLSLTGQTTKISDVIESLLHTDASQTEFEKALYMHCLQNVEHFLVGIKLYVSCDLANNHK